MYMNMVECYDRNQDVCLVQSLFVDEKELGNVMGSFFFVGFLQFDI